MVMTAVHYFPDSISDLLRENPSVELAIGLLLERAITGEPCAVEMRAKRLLVRFLLPFPVS